jgi:phage terminase large subunit-like protein
MTIGPAWVFDDSPIADPHRRGERAVEFLRHLRHPKSILDGKAFQLDPPFERIVRRIYGPSDASGNRLTRVVYLQVGKGSRKTSLSAGLALLHTFGPERLPRGANYVVAADKAQARVAFEEAMSIIQEVPQLAGATRPQDTDARLTHPRSGSFFEALSSDGKRAHARTPMFILVDELWAHQKPDLWQAMRMGASKAPGSLLIVATTAGRGNESPDFPVYQYAKQVQAGEIEDPHFLPIVFEASKDDPWDDEETWHKVLPGLRYGYPDLPSLHQLAREARERPADRAAFEQFFLGIRQDNSLSTFVPMDVFDKGKREPIDLEEMKGRRAIVAVDASTKIDLTAVLAAVEDDAGNYLVKCWGFVPENTARRRSDQDGVDYVRWAEEGWIMLTPGDEIDAKTVETFLRELADSLEVEEFPFDRAYSQPIRGPLSDDGFPITIMQQGWVTQSPALSVLEGAIFSRKVKWDSPVLRWCIENVLVHTDRAGNRTMDKGRSRDRIDLAVCLWMAIARLTHGETDHSWWGSEEAEEAAGLFG